MNIEIKEKDCFLYKGCVIHTNRGRYLLIVEDLNSETLNHELGTLDITNDDYRMVRIDLPIPKDKHINIWDEDDLKQDIIIEVFTPKQVKLELIKK
jgi:hypothetical protein